MSRRLVPDHFKRNGEPKVAFHDAATAEREAIRTDKHVYRCTFCGALHIGGNDDRSAERKQLQGGAG